MPLRVAAVIIVIIILISVEMSSSSPISDPRSDSLCQFAPHLAGLCALDLIFWFPDPGFPSAPRRTLLRFNYNTFSVYLFQHKQSLILVRTMW